MLAKLQTHDEPRQPPPLSIAGVILLPRDCPMPAPLGSVARFARLYAASLRSAAWARPSSHGRPPWVGGSLRSVVCGLASLGRCRSSPLKCDQGATKVRPSRARARVCARWPLAAVVTAMGRAFPGDFPGDASASTEVLDGLRRACVRARVTL